ncbi:MAG: hypothetical protein HFJ20_07115 [Clostridia bacterium]|nr:hypothetical protein [Clostridia bacterium]
MIIVSQDGKCMTEDLNIHIKSYNQKIDEVIYAIENDEFILGYYKTEERAEEVFEEIIKTYKDTNYEYENCWCLRNLVYRMPKE